MAATTSEGVRRAIVVCCLVLLQLIGTNGLRHDVTNSLSNRRVSPSTILRRLADYERTTDDKVGRDAAPPSLNADDAISALDQRLVEYNMRPGRSKRNCQFNLGGHCETENAANLAAQWHYLDSPWSPGRRRKRLNSAAFSAPTSARGRQTTNVLYRQIVDVTSRNSDVGKTKRRSSSSPTFGGVGASVTWQRTLAVGCSARSRAR